MARKTLTDKGVAALKSPSRQKAHYYPDPQMPAHYIRVGKTGVKSYVAVVRDPNGKQRWITIGNAAHIKIDMAALQSYADGLVELAPEASRKEVRIRGPEAQSP